MDCNAFVETRLERDLEKILSFIASQDDDVLYLAYEWNNREMLYGRAAKMAKQDRAYRSMCSQSSCHLARYSAEMREIQKSDLNRYTTIYLCKEAMVMLQGMQDQDAHILAMGIKLVRQHPELDYWARIWTILGKPHQGFKGF